MGNQYARESFGQPSEILWNQHTEPEEFPSTSRSKFRVPTRYSRPNVDQPLDLWLLSANKPSSEFALLPRVLIMLENTRSYPIAYCRLEAFFCFHNPHGQLNHNFSAPEQTQDLLTAGDNSHYHCQGGFRSAVVSKLDSRNITRTVRLLQFGEPFLSVRERLHLATISERSACHPMTHSVRTISPQNMFGQCDGDLH